MFRALVSTLVFSAACISLGSCDQVNPASVCSDPNTVAEIRTLLAKQIAGGKEGVAALGKFDPSFNPLTLTSYDKTTKKIICSAQVNVKMPESAQEFIRINDNAMMFTELATSALVNAGLKDGQADVKLAYSRQPTADGKNFVFTYESNGLIEGLARFVTQLEPMIAQTKAQAPAVTPIPPVDVPKPPEASNIASVDNSLTNTDQ